MCSVLKVTVILQIVVNILADNQTNKIEALEKEKNELYIQINDAIDKSVNLLKNGNDSEALVGVEYLQKLKEQIKEINGTKINDREDPAKGTRRNNKLDMLKIAGRHIYSKNKKKKITKDELESHIFIENKIEEWRQEREMEKQKIKAYKEKMNKQRNLEKCPRFGTQSKKGAKCTKNNCDDKRAMKYPCCRKCCKKSYLGCL